MAVVIDGTTGITTPSVASTGASTFTGALALPAGGLNVGSGQLAVDASGRVTMSAQPAFSAFLSGDTAISLGVQIVVLNNQNLNVGSNFNPANGRFTAPVAGRYQFNAVIALQTTTSSILYLSAEIFKNGSRSATSGWNSKANTTNAYASNAASFVVDLAAADYVQLGTEVNTSATLIGTYSIGCKLSGFLIS